MKVKTRVRISTILSISLALIFGIVLFLTVQKMDEGRGRSTMAGEVVKGVAELEILTYDYLLHHEERAQRQWQSKHNSLAKHVAGATFKGSEEQIFLDRIRHNHISIKGIFAQLTIDSEKRQGLDEVGIAVSQELNERLASRLLMKSQAIVSDAFQLQKAIQAKLVTTQQTGSLLIIVCVGILAVIMPATSAWMSMSVLKPIAELQEGTQITGAGNLDYKVGTAAKDEIGQLSRAFDEMTEKLKITTVSRDELAVEVTTRKQAEEALQKAHDELERRVEERTAELKQEIIERKQTEEVLLETKELLETVFSSMNLLVAYMDTNFNFIRVNRAYAEADNRAAEFFVGKNHFALYPNKENEAIFRKVVEMGKLYFAFEKPFEYAEHPERGVTYWDWSLQPVKELGGKVSGVVLSLVNVTERKRAQEAQRESEYRYRTLFEESRDAVYITSREGEIIGINQSGLDLFGYTREELMESSIREIYVHPKDRHRFQKVIERKGSVRDYEVKFRKKDGIELDCLFTATVRRADDGSVLGYQGIIRDITDRKRAEEVLRESEKQLRYLSSQLLTAQEKERERIARELHDGIGQSLSAVKFSVENSLRQMERETAGSPVKRLETVIPMIQDSIEEVRKIAMDLRPSVLDDLGILATIAWFCREFQTIYSGIRIEQQLDIREDEVPDPLKTAIYRVLQEALNNVAKHSNANLANISLRRMDGMIELVIEDNGMGFDLEEASRKGLGLSSMKERIELSGGSFTIESATGTGTIIQASWPERP